MTTEELINRLEGPRPNATQSDEYSPGSDYRHEIFLLEMPEGGDIETMRAVGFSGWPGTLKNEPTKPVRFYVQVIGFEDVNAPVRNWQINTSKIVIKDRPNLRELYKTLQENI